MAKVSFSSLENRMAFESVAEVSARIMNEAAAAKDDAAKLAIMSRGFEEMAAAEKAKDDIFSLVLRCNLLGVTDGDVSAFWGFVLRFYSVKAARVVFTDFLKKVAAETKRIKKDTAGNWVADLTADDAPAAAAPAVAAETSAEVSADDSAETVNQ